MSDEEPPATDGSSVATAIADGEPPNDDLLSPPPKRHKKRSRRRVLVEWGAVLLAALILAFGIRTFAVQAFFIPSGSMIPTFNIGDRILVDKAFFDYHDLKEGAIVVFSQPTRDTMCGPPETDLVKRVIATPGQTIWSVGNTIYINGRVLNESYLTAAAREDLGPPIKKTTVPQNEFYVLGDNRSISCDSRYWGPVPGKTIVGQVILRWWHNHRPDFHIF